MPAKSKSLTTTKLRTGQRLPTHRPPTHPGEMLLEEFLKPLGVTQSSFAHRLGVSYPRLNELINGRRGVTIDTALRLSQVLGTTPELWMNLQQSWDLWHAINGPQAQEIQLLQPLPLGDRDVA